MRNFLTTADVTSCHEKDFFVDCDKLRVAQTLDAFGVAKSSNLMFGDILLHRTLEGRLGVDVFVGASDAFDVKPFALICSIKPLIIRSNCDDLQIRFEYLFAPLVSIFLSDFLATIFGDFLTPGNIFLCYNSLPSPWKGGRLDTQLREHLVRLNPVPVELGAVGLDVHHRLPAHFEALPRMRPIKRDR